ncbi:hypothetical protein WEI85_18800, partial [Actinomycetes bacterium KLBMP 9797]
MGSGVVAGLLAASLLLSRGRAELLLIHAAAGGVGCLAGQFAAAAGARRIVGVVGNAGQVDYARRFG